MSNGEIYSTALTLAQNFKDTEELFPVAIIYSIQKNIQTLTKIAEDNKTSIPPLKNPPTIGTIDPVVYFKILTDIPLYDEFTIP